MLGGSSTPDLAVRILRRVIHYSLSTIDCLRERSFSPDPLS